MASLQEINDIHLKEHIEQYENFTRLMLSLSVGFITFTTALKGNEADISYLYQLGIALHALSILFGVWLQYILVNRPLVDLKKISEIMSSPKFRSGSYFSRPPSRRQRVCFFMQISSFIAAFFIVVLGVLI
ncbi:hypothetical protein ACRN9A_19510 [Shewanella frigidimarina]|uniref:hypothetical protein n=1 Tax=Shewanella frigidimarina TaxID=56812 RepID=UPI003D7A7FD2